MTSQGGGPLNDEATVLVSGGEIVPFFMALSFVLTMTNDRAARCLVWRAGTPLLRELTVDTGLASG
jgi:hypothetical protein